MKCSSCGLELTEPEDDPATGMCYPCMTMDKMVEYFKRRVRHVNGQDTEITGGAGPIYPAPGGD